jgi:uncharacterized protein YjcR
MTTNFKLLAGEVFKRIEGYDDLKVSTHGRIYSKSFGRCLPLNLNKDNYVTVMLSQGGGDILVHRIVCETFKANPSNLPVVNHIDGCKWNNHIDNLEWLSFRDNTRHAVKTGLFKNRITDKVAGEIRDEYLKQVTSLEDYTYDAISKKYGYSISTIRCIVKNRTWVNPDYVPPILPSQRRETEMRIASEIRQKFASGDYTQKMLVQEYGLSRGVVSNIIQNISFRDPNYTRPSRHTTYVLNFETATQIRADYNTGKIKQVDLAKKYGIAQNTLSKIITNKAWYDPNYVYKLRIVKDGKFYIPKTYNRPNKNSNSTTNNVSLEDVASIREKYASGNYTQLILKTEYNIAYSALHDILYNKSFYDHSYTPSFSGYKKHTNLNEVKIREIRVKYNTGVYNVPDLMREYDISSRDTFLRIVDNITWFDPDYTPVYKESELTMIDATSVEAEPQDEVAINLVKDLRDKYATGDYKQIDLAREYEICQWLVSDIISNRRYHDPNYTYVKRVKGVVKIKGSGLKLDEGEVYIPVKGLEEKYVITNFGRLYTFHKNRFVKGIINPDGFIKYNMGEKSIVAHQLVANHFSDNPNNYPYVIHKDGDKSNNHINNLEWTDNVITYRNKKLITDEIVKDSRTFWATGKYTYQSLSEKLNISVKSLFDIVHNKAHYDPDYIPANDNNNSLKLNKDVAKIIRKQFANGEVTKKELASKYSVTEANIHAVLMNKIYKDLSYTIPSIVNRGWSKGNS